MNASIAEKMPEKYTDAHACGQLDAGYSGQITVTRAGSNRAGVPDLVFVESELTGSLCLTREQAVDLAEVLTKVSGMASSSYAAQFLARAVRDTMGRKGVTRSRVSAVTGIKPKRLRQILAAELPMTHDELVAIAEVDAGTGLTDAHKEATA